MPRSCVVCGAGQSLNISVFSFPTSPHKRAAWIQAIQRVKPEFYETKNINDGGRMRNGVCEKHFLSAEVSRGKKCRLHREAVPSFINKNPKVSSIKKNTGNKHYFKEQHSTLPTQILENFNQKENLKKEYFELGSTRLLQNNVSKKEICLICGNNKNKENSLVQIHLEKVDSNITLKACQVLEVPESILLSVSILICSKCLKLINEVKELEEELNGRKKIIRLMFKDTAKENINIVESCTSYFSTNEKQQNESKDIFCDISTNEMIENTEEVIEIKDNESINMNKQFWCKYCQLFFPAASQLIDHLKEHTTGEYNCEECGISFFCKQTLLSHSSTHHKGSDCTVCGRLLTTKARLKAHMFKFHGIGEGQSKVFNCPECDKSFGTKAGLRYHSNVVHQVGSKYICEHCNKVFFYHVPYKSHLLYAHGQKKIVCETCGEMFFTVSKLNTHINAVHRNAQTWSCDECSCKFTTSTAYRHHMHVKHQKVKHMCDHCPSEFKKKSSLYVHLWKHDIFICRTCHINFSHVDPFRKHMAEFHGKDISIKIKKPNSVATSKSKKLLKSTKFDITKSENTEQSFLQERDTSVMINDLLMTSGEAFDNTELQEFTLNSSKHLEKEHFHPQNSLKVKTLNIIETEDELPSVEEFGQVVEPLDMKSSHEDSMELNPEVSLINVQILGGLEDISQSDSHLDDMEIPENNSLEESLMPDTNTRSMVTDEEGQLSCQPEQLIVQKSLSEHLSVENDHNSHLSEQELDSTSDALVTHANLDATNVSPLTVHHLHSIADIEPVESIHSVNHLEAVVNLEPVQSLNSVNHLESVSHLDTVGHLEGNEENICSIPVMISQIDEHVSSQMVSHLNDNIGKMQHNVGNVEDITGDDLVSHVDRMGPVSGMVTDVGELVEDVEGIVEGVAVGNGLVSNDHMSSQISSNIVKDPFSVTLVYIAAPNEEETNE